MTIKGSIASSSMMNQERWLNLKWNIQQARIRIESESDRLSNWCQADILSELLLRLENFGGEAVDWILDSANHPGSSSQHILDLYPIEYGQSLIPSQISQDLGVIWQIYTQRRDNLFNIEDTIKIIVEQAQNALKPAVDAGIVRGPIQILPYFQKAPSIRIIPYANVALLGMPMWLSRIRPDPLTLTKTMSQELLAIPHEVGHFVYWYGRKKYRASGDRFEAALVHHVKAFLTEEYAGDSKNPDPRFVTILQWAEEVFADVYGVWVDKAASLASHMKTILNGNRQSRMLETDDAHPAGLIRPYAPLTALRAIDKNREEQKATEYLESFWKEMPFVKAAIQIASNQPEEKVALLKSPDRATRRTGSAGSAVSQGKSFQESLEVLGKWVVTNLLKAPSDSSAADKSLQPAEFVEDILDKWGKENTSQSSALKSSSKLSFETTWHDWVDSIYHCYDHMNLSPYAHDSKNVQQQSVQLRWLAAITAGGWTDGPNAGGNPLR